MKKTHHPPLSKKIIGNNTSSTWRIIPVSNLQAMDCGHLEGVPQHVSYRGLMVFYGANPLGFMGLAYLPTFALNLWFSWNNINKNGSYLELTTHHPPTTYYLWLWWSSIFHQAHPSFDVQVLELHLASRSEGKRRNPHSPDRRSQDGNGRNGLCKEIWDGLLVTSKDRGSKGHFDLNHLV